MWRITCPAISLAFQASCVWMAGMKNPIIFGAIMLALGISIGWVAKPVPDSDKTSATAGSSDMSAAQAPPRSTSNSSTESATPRKVSNRPPKPDSPAADELTPEVMEQAREMQSQMTKKMIAQQRQKFETQIDRLTESLSLNGDQKSRLTAWLDERLKVFDDADLTDMAAFTETFADESLQLTEKAMQAQLEGTLTPEQQTALTDYQDREHANKVDTIALKNLSKLQGIIHFEEGQRDEVYKILSANAEENLSRETNTPNFSSMFTEGMGIEMDPYGLNLEQAMTEAMGDYTNAESGEEQGMMDNFRRVIADRIDAKVEALRPVLNDRQLESYRTELQTKGLGVYGSVLEGMEGNLAE